MTTFAQIVSSSGPKERSVTITGSGVAGVTVTEKGWPNPTKRLATLDVQNKEMASTIVEVYVRFMVDVLIKIFNQIH